MNIMKLHQIAVLKYDFGKFTYVTNNRRLTQY